MDNEMPKLEPGMVIEFDWKHVHGSSLREYVFLGDDRTLNLTNPDDRSQPLRLFNSEAGITKIYTVKNVQSWGDYLESSNNSCRHLIWKKEEEPKTRDMTNEELIELWYTEPCLRIKLINKAQPRIIIRVDPTNLKGSAIKVDNEWVRINEIDSYTTDGKTWKKLEVEK